MKITVNVELNHRKRIDGLSCVLIRITENKKHKRISSDIYVLKKEYRHQAKWGTWIRESHPESDKLNKDIEQQIKKIKDYYKEHQIVNPVVAIKGKDFFKFADEYIKQFNHQAQKGTYDTYVSKLKKLEKYLGKRSLAFTEITVSFLMKYKNHLKEDGNKINTIAVDLKKIRAIFNQAIREDFVDYSKNPFPKIKIEYERTSKDKLSKEDLDVIRNLDLEPGGYLWDARNIFLFCINCMGERIGAVLRLKVENLQGNSLYYLKNKGKKSKNVDLTPEALRILACYPKRKKYLFPYLDGNKDEHMAVKTKTALINNALEAIRKKTTIDKKITTHVARHTLTKLAIDSGIDMRSLQSMLDHSTIAITEHYAGDIADKTGNEALMKIFETPPYK